MNTATLTVSHMSKKLHKAQGVLHGNWDYRYSLFKGKNLNIQSENFSCEIRCGERKHGKKCQWKELFEM